MHRESAVDVYSALRNTERHAQDIPRYHSTTQYVLLGIAPFTPVPLPSGPSLDSPLRKFWTCGSPEVQMGNESESIARWLFSAKEKSLIPLGRFTY